MRKFNYPIKLTLKEPLRYQAEICFDIPGQLSQPTFKLVPRKCSRQLLNILKREEVELEEVAKFLKKQRIGKRLKS